MSLDLSTWLDERQQGSSSREEERVRSRIRKEAAAAGCALSDTEQHGGILPSLALGVFRRDGWRCKVCNAAADIELHHKGGIPESERLARLGHADVFHNLVTLCRACHNRLHEEHRAEMASE